MAYSAYNDGSGTGGGGGAQGPAPASASQKTGPITDPTDPRLSDPAFSTDPNVLAYYGQPGGAVPQIPLPPGATRDPVTGAVVYGSGGAPQSSTYNPAVNGNGIGSNVGLPGANGQPITGPAPPAAHSPVTSTGGIPTGPVAPLPNFSTTPPPNVAPVTGAYSYTPGSLSTGPLPTYQAAQIGQYSAPDLSSQNAQMQALQNAIMTNPDTFNPAVVAAEKEGQKETVGSSQQAAIQQAQQSAAQRGTTFGGSLGSTLANIADTSQGNLTTGYRNIDLNAATQNRAAELAALGSSDTLANSLTGRATQNYNTQLGGQTAQAGQNYQAYQSQAAAQQFALEQALAQEQAKQAAGQQQLSQSSTQASQNINQSQFNQSQQLAWSQFLNDMLMGRNSQGLSQAQLQLLNQQLGIGVA